MPKRISNKNKSSIFCAYKIGESKGKTRYTNQIFPLDCQFTRYNGITKTDIYGKEISFVATAIFEYSEKTQYIDEFCKFWQSLQPENGNVFAEYSVAGMSNIVDGLFTVYLSENTKNNNCLWFLGDDNEIYEIQGIYDYDTKKFIIPQNMYCPIEHHTKVWEIEPETAESTEGLLSLTYKNKEINNVVLEFELV